MALRTLTTILLLSWIAPGEAGAQQGPRCPAVARSDSARAADVVIRASARAAEVRFTAPPRLHVRMSGCSVLDSVRVVERRNLPEKVRPDVTYRDVYVAVEILGHLDLQCVLPTLAAQLAPVGEGTRTPRLCAPQPADSAAAPTRR